VVWGRGELSAKLHLRGALLTDSGRLSSMCYPRSSFSAACAQVVFVTVLNHRDGLGFALAICILERMEYFLQSKQRFCVSWQRASRFGLLYWILWVRNPHCVGLAGSDPLEGILYIPCRKPSSACCLHLHLLGVLPTNDFAALCTKASTQFDFVFAFGVRMPDRFICA